MSDPIGTITLSVDVGGGRKESICFRIIETRGLESVLADQFDDLFLHQHGSETIRPLSLDQKCEDCRNFFCTCEQSNVENNPMTIISIKELNEEYDHEQAIPAVVVRLIEGYKPKEGQKAGRRWFFHDYMVEDANGSQCKLTLAHASIDLPREAEGKWFIFQSQSGKRRNSLEGVQLIEDEYQGKTTIKIQVKETASIQECDRHGNIIQGGITPGHSGEGGHGTRRQPVDSGGETRTETRSNGRQPVDQGVAKSEPQSKGRDVVADKPRSEKSSSYQSRAPAYICDVPVEERIQNHVRIMRNWADALGVDWDSQVLPELIKSIPQLSATTLLGFKVEFGMHSEPFWAGEGLPPHIAAGVAVNAGQQARNNRSEPSSDGSRRESPADTETQTRGKEEGWRGFKNPRATETMGEIFDSGDIDRLLSWVVWSIRPPKPDEPADMNHLRKACFEFANSQGYTKLKILNRWMLGSGIDDHAFIYYMGERWKVDNPNKLSEAQMSEWLIDFQNSLARVQEIAKFPRAADGHILDDDIPF